VISSTPKKLTEDGFNRIFLNTMCDKFQMVACIPYLATILKKLVVASEVATMASLRRHLFRHASDMWEGETLALKVAPIDATQN
jgi:hypothetical protein